MKFKDLLILGFLAVISFPVIYIGALFMTGNAHIEFLNKADKQKEGEKKEFAFIRQSARKDSLAASQSHAFLALEKSRADIESEKEKLQTQEERMAMLQQELENVKTELTRKKKELEQVVAQSSELDRKRIAQLAKVYGAMRAAEAAQILETLDEDLAVTILTAINDDRQKAKIFAALPAEKAASLSQRMGKR